MKKNKIIKLLIPFLYSTLTYSSVINIDQTTRIQSSAGVGVGAVLLDEATLLNPAPMAFYQIGAIYYQQAEVSSESAQNDIGKSKNTLIIASDSKGPVGGSISYNDGDEGKIINVSLATPVSKKSALGVTYRNIETSGKKKLTSFDLGVSHAMTEFFTFGAVLKNPQRVENLDTRLVLGTQFVYQEFISLMLDFGTDWKNELSSDLMYGAAIQFKTFSDIYLRMGTSRDKKYDRSQSGIGLSWVSPRILMSLAVSNLENQETSVKSRNTSFSVSYKF